MQINLDGNFRKYIITGVTSSILGPKFGINEVLHETINPWKLYLTGVLAPISAKIDEESERGEVDPVIQGEQDQVDQIVNNPFSKEPGLSSNSQPRSMGISFVLTSKKDCPVINVCFTWARYRWFDDWRVINNGIDFEEYVDLINPDLEKRVWFKEPKEEVLKERDNTDELNGDDDPEKSINNNDHDKKESNENDDRKGIPFGGWKRVPYYLIFKNVKLCPEYNDQFYFVGSKEGLNEIKDKGFIEDFEGNILTEGEKKFAIKFKIDKLDDIFKISIFFVNIALYRKNNDPAERGKWINFYIFQPQIRVNCGDGTSVLPYDKMDKDEVIKINEENNLKLLYFDSRQKCRGHMCSALWKKIDPERNNIRLPNFDPSFLNGPPFFWVDGELLVPTSKKYFTCPDVRSEYIPIYSVSAPDFSLRNIKKREGENVIWESEDDHPILDPEILAENCLDYNKLSDILSFLPDQYQKWIDFTGEIITNVYNNDPERQWGVEIAERNLKNHKDLLETIKEGIEELVKPANIDLRLSFGFANKAISLQNFWSRKSFDFRWRTFQLAFVLMSIKAIIDSNGKERDIVDLIWIPTGGGKTEAYLFLAAFSFAYRRRRAIIMGGDGQDALENGTYLISRYTLRLLTIQQFRRGTNLIVACELLRIRNLNCKTDIQNTIIGWLPNSVKNDDNFKSKFIQGNGKNRNWLWGTSRFSIGLWVGGSLTPNRLKSIPRRQNRNFIYGADLALKVRNSEWYIRRQEKAHEVTKEIGDPAQITKCPICNSTLSFPKLEGQYLPTESILYLLVYKEGINKRNLHVEISRVIDNVINPNYDPRMEIHQIFDGVGHLDYCEDWAGDNLYVLQFNVKTNPKFKINCTKLEEFWDAICTELGEIYLVSTHILNPGYFYKGIGTIITYEENQKIGQREDFTIRCCNPKCELNRNYWMEKINIGKIQNWTKIDKPWRSNDNNPVCSIGVPITAYTVDQQVYKNFPTLLIGTVDKFVQLTYRKEASTIFGNLRNINIDFYLEPPDIILQDELHLINGPLGSMVGIYEVLIDELSKRYDNNGKVIKKPKYIASTATIRSGKTQVESLYIRSLRSFPPNGISHKDSFFLVNQDLHQLIDKDPGRLYIGICCPGKSKISPQIHLWAEFFHIPYIIKKRILNNPSLNPVKKKLLINKLDQFWTIVGYFNAIRELATTRSVYTQEFISWMKLLYGENIREILKKDEPIELSSRTDSVLLPNYFEDLGANLGFDFTPVNGVLTTSIFGTGVDVSRLGVMIVNGQPKTHSSYIQATGRIGRQKGGIVCTFYHSFRPRDLSHYELFGTYHSSLYKNVEPISVTPFAPECISQTLGGIVVAFLRQGTSIRQIPISMGWTPNESGPNEIRKLVIPPDLENLIQTFLDVIEQRRLGQPNGRDFLINAQIDDFKERLLYWQNNQDLVYKEYCFQNMVPEKSVVCGDPRHEAAQKEMRGTIIIFDNVPNSLRGVEKTTTFGLFVNR